MSTIRSADEHGASTVARPAQPARHHDTDRQPGGITACPGHMRLKETP